MERLIDAIVAFHHPAVPGVVNHATGEFEYRLAPPAAPGSECEEIGALRQDLLRLHRLLVDGGLPLQHPSELTANFERGEQTLAVRPFPFDLTRPFASNCRTALAACRALEDGFAH